MTGGGAERVLLNIAKKLYYENYEVELVVVNLEGSFVAEVEYGIKVHDLKIKSIKKAAFPLLRLFRQKKPKLIFSTLGYVNLLIILMGWLLPKETKIWIREANMPNISIRSNKYKYLMLTGYRLLYCRADLIICSSKLMRNQLIEDFNVPSSKIKVLPNPVDDKMIVKNAWPVKRHPGKGVRFVAAGRLTHQKGFDRLLDCFYLMKNREAHLVIFGEGPLKKELVNKAKKLCVLDRVIFFGFSDNIWQWMAGADAFLLSSRWEGMPNVALESLCCGTLVIATSESGGIKELSDQAMEGSVTVAKSMDEFFRAMSTVEIKKQTGYCRKSLLPNQYSANYAVSEFQEWIEKLS